MAIQINKMITIKQ